LRAAPFDPGGTQKKWLDHVDLERTICDPGRLEQIRTALKVSGRAGLIRRAPSHTSTLRILALPLPCTGECVGVRAICDVMLGFPAVLSIPVILNDRCLCSHPPDNYSRAARPVGQARAERWGSVHTVGPLRGSRLLRWAAPCSADQVRDTTTRCRFVSRGVAEAAQGLPVRRRRGNEVSASDLLSATAAEQSLTCLFAYPARGRRRHSS